MVGRWIANAEAVVTVVYEPTRLIPAGARSRSMSARADEMIRVAPRGIRTALVPVAKGEQSLDDLPEWEINWLVRREAVKPAESTNATWARTKLMKALLQRIEARYS